MEKPENCETDTLSIEEGIKETKVKNYIYMLPSKLTYLFLWGLLYSYIPFLYVFFISVGLTASQAGLITGLRYLVSFIAGPVWAAIADYTSRHRLIYCLLCIGTIISIFPMPWIAEWVNPKEHGITNQHEILNLTNSTFNLRNGKQNPLSSNDKLFKVMLSLGLISAAFALPMLGYVDSVIIKIVRCCKQKTTYSNQRMFGAVGAGLFNLIAGVAADKYSNPKLSGYTAVFFVALATGLALLPMLYILSSQSISKERTETDHKSKDVLKKVFKIYGKLNNVLFLLTLLLRGIANTVTINFLFLFLDDELNVSKSIMGFSFAVGCGAEIIMYPFASRIMKLLGGPYLTLILVIFTYFLRLLLLSFVRNQWLILPIQALHSICAGLYYPSSVEYVNMISNKEIAATMFTVASGMNICLGSFLANICGGVLYDRYGGRALFRTLSYICLGWCLIMLVYLYVSYLSTRKKVEKQANNAEQGTFLGNPVK